MATVDYAENFAVVRGHPHNDDEDTVLPPLAVRIAAERPAVLLDAGDGTSMRVPVDDDDEAMLPGSSGAVAAGCLCDPVRNQRTIELHATPPELRPADGRVELAFDPDCPLHTRVEAPPARPPRVKEPRGARSPGRRRPPRRR
jgi:hypothetical protein